MTRSLAAALGLVLALAATPALAHSELRRSTPANGARLAAPPERIELTFNEPAQVTTLRLRGPDGAEIRLPEPLTLRATPVETARLPALGPGPHQLDWRAISADGHPVGGTIRFTILGGGGS
jgi:methionine-rich copper-binding protein CopC